jgi:hypothetical protein
MALHRNVLHEGDILCELYVDTHSDVSDYSDNESIDSGSDVPTTSSSKQLRFTGPLTPQFPHPFFFTVLNPFGRPGILVTTASKHTMRANRGILRDFAWEGMHL